MFRDLSAHLQEDTVVYMHHMLLSLCKQVSGRPLACLQSESTICCMYTTVSSWRWALKARNLYRKIIFY